MKKILQKKCTGCQKMFPLTQKYFFWAFSKKRGKSYPVSKCKTCLRELSKEYAKKNAQKLRENHRAYDRSPKGIYKKLKHSARSWKVEMTQDEFVEWYNSQPKVCSYCGIDELTLKIAPDAYNNKTRRMTIDRIDSTKHYSLTNITLCCLRCNHIKGNFFTQSEMVEIGSMFIKPKWKKYVPKKTS